VREREKEQPPEINYLCVLPHKFVWLLRLRDFPGTIFRYVCWRQIALNSFLSLLWFFIVRVYKINVDMECFRMIFFVRFFFLYSWTHHAELFFEKLFLNSLFNEIISPKNHEWKIWDENENVCARSESEKKVVASFFFALVHLGLK
jgi:hypothetical protein